MPGQMMSTIFGITVEAGEAAAEVAGHAAGAALHGLISSAVATNQTKKSRRKEKLSTKCNGLDGNSRTKSNKEVAKSWSGAVAGTGGSLGGAALGTVRYCFNYQSLSYLTRHRMCVRRKI